MTETLTLQMVYDIVMTDSLLSNKQLDYILTDIKKDFITRMKPPEMKLPEMKPPEMKLPETKPPDNTDKKNIKPLSKNNYATNKQNKQNKQKNQKYIDAQVGVKGYSSYENALLQISKCRKRGDWIWYIFPQPPHVKATSDMSKKYSLETVDVKGYLDQSILKNRYNEIVTMLQSCLQTVPLRSIVDSDDVKVISSLKSFRDGTSKLIHADTHKLCIDTLKMIQYPSVYM